MKVYTYNINITKKSITGSFMSIRLSHLHDHKFKQFSRHIESTLHLWKDIETTSHYLVLYDNFTNERSTLQ